MARYINADVAIEALIKEDRGCGIDSAEVIRRLPTADISPCDVCAYNPPSSGDNKPCTMCVAEGVSE